MRCEKKGLREEIEGVIDAEKSREAAKIAERFSHEDELDLEAMEFFARSQMLGVGARVVESFLAERLEEEEAPVCGDNHPPRKMVPHDRRAKTIRTILGEVGIVRRRFICLVCGAARYPADERLGVAGTEFSPGARRMMARAGAQESFAQAASDLALFANLRVEDKAVERVAETTGQLVDDWMRGEGARSLLTPSADENPDTLYIEFDGTGAPMRREELQASRGKAPDGKAHTREVKVGCVFTQSGLDEEGDPVRDEGSTTYVAAIENSTDFGHRVYQEAVRRGLRAAARVVVISDGAAYNKTIVAEHFPQATHILDLYHAQEHLAQFVRDVLREPLDSAQHERLRDLLCRGKIALLAKRMSAALPRSGPRRTAGEKAIGYFRDNAHAMRYGEFRAMGLFVGSGVVEAACRTLVGQRLKRSGMFWSVRGANAILALRSCYASGRFEQFWEDAA